MPFLDQLRWSVLRIRVSTIPDFGEGHPFCPPGAGDSVYSRPEMSTRLCESEGGRLLLASARVQPSPSESELVTKPQKIFANDVLYQLSYTPKFFAERP
jgi:hypothetical protein